jgi:amino acid adenylation domain-containing protein
MPVETGPRVLYLEDLRFSGEQIGENLPVCARPQHLAYVIYTSGSTGAPKGTMIEQRGMLNHLYAKVDALGLSDADTIAQTASQCFDISVWQFLAALLVGGRVHIFKDEVSHDPERLLLEVERQRVTILETVPSLLHMLLQTIETGAGNKPRLQLLRWLIPTGEALPPAFCGRWLAAYPHIPLLNAYGPTECSDDVTHFPIYRPLEDDLVNTPIGRPIPNMRLYILDRTLNPLPLGVAGELYVGGVGVGRGYLGDPQRTAEAFLVDADPAGDGAPGRLYKTGDLARYRPDGTIEFLGRIDHQVKLRGYRIELGEIETVLGQHEAVRQAVVVARQDAPGDKRLAAYVVPAEGSALDTAELKQHLLQSLPAYMLPGSFVVLEALPLTPNGKLDRAALPAPEPGQFDRRETYAAPRNDLEEVVAGTWEEVLGVEQVGIHDSFFELGGHSLLLMQVISRLRSALQVELLPGHFAGAHTVAQFAASIEHLKSGGAQQGAPALRRRTRPKGSAPSSPTLPKLGERAF